MKTDTSHDREMNVGPPRLDTHDRHLIYIKADLTCIYILLLAKNDIIVHFIYVYVCVCLMIIMLTSVICNKLDFHDKSCSNGLRGTEWSKNIQSVLSCLGIR